MSEEEIQDTQTQEAPQPVAETSQTTPQKKSVIAILKENPAYNDLSKFVHWRDPIRTGLFFGIFNFFYLLLTWREYTVVSLLSYMSLAMLLVCFAYANFVVLKAKWIQGKNAENPFKERFQDETFHLSRETAVKHLDTVIDLINVGIDRCREVFYCTNNILSLKYAAYFYITATVGTWFSGATLLYLAALVLFIWPRLYEEKQKEIDHYYALAMANVEKYIQLGLSKLPPAVTNKFPALKPKAQ